MFDLQAKAAAVQLLVVEAFAGTYPVARVLQHVNSSVQSALGVRLQAYVGIEVQEELAKKAPSADDLGLDKQHYLNFKGQQDTGDIQSPSVQQKVLDFVRSKLQDKQLGIDAALVFGGPTCTVYSCLIREDTRFPNRYKGFAAEAEHTEVIRQLAVARKNLHDLRSSNRLFGAFAGSRGTAACQPVAAAAAVPKRVVDSSSMQLHAADSIHGFARHEQPQQQRQQQQQSLLPPMAAALLAASQAEEQLAAEAAALEQQRRLLAGKASEEAQRDAAALMESDALASSFITLYRGVQAECMAYGDIPSYMIMENPYSVTNRALWNRPFMKAQHLLDLPRAAAADRVKQQSSWAPSSTAWLHSTWQNWCCYSKQHSQKNTIVFTNLPKGSLEERRCPQDCLTRGPDSAADAAAAGGSKESRRRGKAVHPVSIRGSGGGPSVNAAWPLPFVESVIKACVGAVRRQRQGGAAGAA
uniref:Uncharacterized protein n=1 Tax=Tetradesmus obliquus TaxID=3088 RepID=A0A383W5P4_TETOB|eukprot:jgi/Sobl393_1/11992/SZX71986.1